MYKIPVLILTTMIIAISGCSINKPEIVKEYVYIEKQKLNLGLPQEPDISLDISLADKDGLVCQSPDSYRSLISNIVELDLYIRQLRSNLAAYKQYYESSNLSNEAKPQSP